MDTNKTMITVSGILCITLLEIAAIFKGIDGILLTAVIGTIATIVGYAYGHKKG